MAGLRSACDIAVQNMSAYISSLKEGTGFDKIVNTYRMALLSNPATHFSNILGNLTNAAAMQADDTAAAFVDSIVSAIGNKPRSVMAPSAREYLAGTRQGLKEAPEVFHGRLRGAGEKFEGGTVHYDNAFFEQMNRFIFKSLEAEDHVAWTAAYRRAINQQARLAAHNSGGDAKMVEHLTENPTDAMHFEAALDADRATFKQRNQLTSLIEKGRSGLTATARQGKEARDVLANGRRTTKTANELREASRQGVAASVVKAGTEMVAPFTKVPTNVAASTLSRTPIGLGSGLYDFASGSIEVKSMLRAASTETNSRISSLLETTASQMANKNRAELLRSVARAGNGAALIYAGYLLAEEGLARGPVAPGAQGAAERQQMAMTGEVENGVKIGNSWIDVNRFAPGGSLIALGAHLNRIAKEGKNSTFLSSVVAPISDAAANTFIGDVSDKADNVTSLFQGDVGGGLGREAGQTLGGFIPNVIAAGSKGMDPYERNTAGEGFLENLAGQIEARTPLRLGMDPRNSPLGTPELRGQGFVGSLLSPTRYKNISSEESARIGRELASHGVNLSVPSASYRNPETGEIAKFSRSDRNRYTGIAGKYVREALSDAINDPSYHTSTPEEQAYILRETIKRAKERSRKAGLSEALGLR